MPYANWLQANAPTYLQDTYGQAWMGGIGAAFDDYVQQYISGILAAFPDYAPSDALSTLGDELGLSQGPYESNTSYAARLRAAWIYWKLAGTPLGLLVALHFAGFTGAVIVQQNGLGYKLSADPTPGVDPSSLLVVSTLDTLSTALTPSAPSVTTIPAGTPWWFFDGNTEFCSRFEVLFPVFSPIFFYSNGTRATFSATDSAAVTWPVAASNNTYQTIVGPPVVTDSSGPVILAVDATTKTTSGCTVIASSPFTGYANISEGPALNTTDLARLKNVILAWKPAKTTCVNASLIVSGRMWGWPLTTWGTGAWGGSVTSFFSGGF
jgi:hypothetical protein